MAQTAAQKAAAAKAAAAAKEAAYIKSFGTTPTSAGINPGSVDYENVTTPSSAELTTSGQRLQSDGTYEYYDPAKLGMFNRPTTTAPTTTETTTTETTTSSTTTAPTTTLPYTYTGTTGVSPEQVGGGGATGTMPGGATAFSGGFTQADIDAAFKKGQEQAAAKAKADADAAAKAIADNKYAQKVSAVDKMIATFKAKGIDDKEFSDLINSEIMNDTSTEDLLLKLPDTKAYQNRFPGMKALTAKNRAITEDSYIKAENQIVETLRFYDLPKGFYDNREMMGKIIGNEVSPKEVQDRAQAAQDLAKATNPQIRTALKEFYNLGEGDITAYMLNADIAGPLVLKQARAAEIAGLAKTAGFSAFDSNAAEALAQQDVYNKLSLSDLAAGIGKAGVLSETQKRLAYLENQTYNDKEALAATFEADQQSILASQKRAAREGARFSGGSGLSSGSLRESSGI